jgi:hypothetical protein
MNITLAITSCLDRTCSSITFVSILSFSIMRAGEHHCKREHDVTSRCVYKSQSLYRCWAFLSMPMRAL